MCKRRRDGDGGECICGNVCATCNINGNAVWKTYCFWAPPTVQPIARPCLHPFPTFPAPPSKCTNFPNAPHEAVVGKVGGGWRTF